MLLGDGVYAAVAGTHAYEALQGSPARVHVLLSDALLAGVNPNVQGIVPIDMEGLVSLTENFPRQQAWY